MIVVHYRIQPENQNEQWKAKMIKTRDIESVESGKIFLEERVIAIRETFQEVMALLGELGVRCSFVDPNPRRVRLEDAQNALEVMSHEVIEMNFPGDDQNFPKPKK